MSLVSLVVTLIVIGVLLWLVNNYIPMDGKIKQILNAVVVIFVVLWLLSVFGLLGNACGARVPRFGAVGSALIDRDWRVAGLLSTGKRQAHLIIQTRER